MKDAPRAQAKERGSLGKGAPAVIAAGCQGMTPSNSQYAPRINDLRVSRSRAAAGR